MPKEEDMHSPRKGLRSFGELWISKQVLQNKNRQSYRPNSPFTQLIQEEVAQPYISESCEGIQMMWKFLTQIVLVLFFLFVPKENSEKRGKMKSLLGQTQKGAAAKVAKKKISNNKKNKNNLKKHRRSQNLKGACVKNSESWH